MVQLANFRDDQKKPAGGDGYTQIRDAQRKALDLKNSGMAVITDIKEARDIHPKNKQDVGRRLDVVPSGPLDRAHKVEGNSIRLSFDYVGSRLIAGKKQGLEPV